jgi:tripartite-type tricarboxylate transporter receptor subunit TctC
MGESGVPGFDSTSWFGMMAPAGTPGDVLAKVHDDVVRTLRLPEVQASLKAQGLTPIGDTPAEFGALLRTERATYARVIRDGGIQVD